MIHKKVFRLFWIWILILGLISISSAFAASNTYTVTYADREIIPITANQLSPAECRTINLTNIVTGSGNIQGTNASDLIFGSSSADKINAKKGNDCIVGGGGDDELRGGEDDDILLGGLGDDELKGETGIDTCYGGGGSDTTDGTCETIYEVP